MLEKKIKKFFYGFGIFMSLFLLLVSALILFSAVWVTTNWGLLSFESIIFQLKSPIHGTGNGMIRDYIFRAALPAILILAIGICVYIFVVRRISKKDPHSKKAKISYSVTLSSTFVVAILLLAFGVNILWNKAGLGEYIHNINTESDWIEMSYVDPAKTSLTFPEKKRNLIYIFLESVELTYTDEASGGAFKYNCLPNLTALAQSEGADNFRGTETKLNGGHALSCTTWTMGAMFGQTSGLPLKIAIDGNSMDTQEAFFPSITTLGDILEDNGYKNVLSIGSDAAFGGREAYFTGHGNYEIHDYKYAQANKLIPENYFVFWGFEDQKLFEFAKNDLSELAKSDQPFNYTMLTVDTHFEDGYVCEQCKNELDTQYANVMRCSDRQVTEFVKWCQSQDWYDNTTIVLVGDHPTMDKDFCQDVPSSYDRTVFLTILNSAVDEARPNDFRTISTFDMFPTTVAALGIKIKGERLGLGTNLYSTEDTLTEAYGIDKEQQELKRHSDFMDRISEVDTNSKKMLERQDTYLERPIIMLAIDDSVEKIYTEAENKNSIIASGETYTGTYDPEKYSSRNDKYDQTKTEHVISAVFSNADSYNRSYIDHIIVTVKNESGKTTDYEMSPAEMGHDIGNYFVYSVNAPSDYLTGKVSLSLKIITRSGKEISQPSWIRRADPK